MVEVKILCYIKGKKASESRKIPSNESWEPTGLKKSDFNGGHRDPCRPVPFLCSARESVRYAGLKWFEFWSDLD